MAIRILSIVLLFIFSHSLLAQKCNTYIPYRIGKLWGYSDIEGKIIIQPKYDKVELFEKDVAKVFKLRDNKIIRQSEIDTMGNLYVPLRYQRVYKAIKIKELLYNQYRKENKREWTSANYENFSASRKPQIKNSLFVVIDSINKCALYDSETKVQLTKSVYDNIYFLTFKNSTLLFTTKINNRYGIIDQNGKVIEKCVYGDINITTNSKGQDSIVFVKPVDKVGMVAINEDEDGYMHVAGGDGIIKDSESKRYGVMGYKGKYVVDPIYDTLFNYGNSNNLVAKKDGRYGVIINDSIAIPLKYDSIIYYDYTYNRYERKIELLAIVSLNSKYGIVNELNQIVAPVEFDSIVKVSSVTTQQYSLFPTLMKKDGKWGMYDEEFKMVVPHLYDGIGEARFHNKAHNRYECVVKKQDKWGVVNEDNNELYPFIFNDIIRINPYINYGVVLISKPENYYSGIYFRGAPDKSVYDAKGVELYDKNIYNYQCQRSYFFVVFKINNTGKEKDAYYINNSGFRYCDDK